MTQYEGLGRQRARRGRAAKGWMFVAGLWVTGSLGCAGAPAPASETAADAANPEAAQSENGGAAAVAKLEHESEPGPLQPVTVPGAFEGQIESNSPVEVTRNEGAVQLVADPGWGYPVRCFVYDEGVDMGTLVSIVLQEAAKAVQFKSLLPYVFNHDGMAPEIGVRGIYTVQRPEGKLMGDLKIVVAERQERPVMCMVDGPGNAQGLARLLHGLASSLRIESDVAEPTWAELWQVMVGNLTVGYAIERTYEFEDGTAQRVSLKAMFLPVAPGQLMATDDARVTTVDGDRQINEVVYYRAENGEPRMSIKLTGEDKHYQVSGTVRGKPFEQAIEMAGPLVSSLAMEDRIRELAKVKGSATFSQLEYMPSADPAEAVEVTYQAGPSDTGMEVEARIGELVMHLIADEQGNGTQSIIPIGSQEMRLVKVLQQGTP